MHIKKMVLSFTYDREQNMISFIGIQLNDYGMIEQKKQYQCNPNEVILDNLHSILDYISEIESGLHRKQWITLEIENSLYVNVIYDSNKPDANLNLIVNDDEVLEWIKVIQKQLSNYID